MFAVCVHVRDYSTYLARFVGYDSEIDDREMIASEIVSDSAYDSDISDTADTDESENIPGGLPDDILG